MSDEELFHEALQKPPGERAAYLDEACRGDDAWRHRVEILLGAHASPGSFLASPVVDLSATVDRPPAAEGPGTVVGPYKLLERIGEGGFGVVFLAEQAEPVRRKVALKVLKPGMDSRQVVARFEAERQALAIMDHPNIARVFDGGATPSGRPYFVMELVKGVPITEFCDRHRLPPRQRLELFVSVCQAVQHAHQKGVIHRDLKPSNVLVSRHDTTPVVKVIDFGVAKALGQELTDKTLFTGVAQMIGTPLYMSPEQAGMSDLDVDTRSDIYSLGVLLYELLTGTTPFPKERFRQAAYDEIRRILREEEPPKPSTRLSDSTASLPSVAAQRQTEPARLTKLVRGELDWVVMKALEKDRGRRYETANAFAADVLRYLADEPVQAVPPSAGYRFRKFARRNKGGLAVAALLLVFLVVLGSGAGWAWRDRAAREAESARQRGERQARAGGQIEVVFAELDQLEREQKWPDALAAARRAEAIVAGGEVDAATEQRVRERLKDLAFIDRLERIRMAKATWVEGRFDNASADREYARAFREYGVDIDELGVATSLVRLKARPALAIPAAAALDDWADIERGSAGDDVTRLKRREAVARGIDPDPVADLLRSRWDRPLVEVQAELRRLVQSIDLQKQHPGTIKSLAMHFYQFNQEPIALQLLRDAQRIYPGDFWLNYTLAHCLQFQKDYEGAVRYYTAAVSIRPRATAALNNLGNALMSLKRLDEAVATFRRALDVDPDFAYAHIGLGNALHRQQRPDLAVDHYRKATGIDPKSAVAHFNLGDTLAEQNKLEEAADAFCEAIKHDRKLIPAYLRLARVLERQNRLGEALDWLR